MSALYRFLAQQALLPPAWAQRPELSVAEVRLPTSLRACWERALQQCACTASEAHRPEVQQPLRSALLHALLTERMRQKAARVLRWVEQSVGDWERAFFIALARAFGLGRNAAAFEQWAATIDPQHVGKHRDQLFQVEAFFFGQAGLLADTALPPERRDAHFRALQAEYAFLCHKFPITPLDAQIWSFQKLRPQNFPHRRLAELSVLYASRAISFSAIRSSDCVDVLRKSLRISLDGYWSAHYAFGLSSQKMAKKEDKENAAKKFLPADLATDASISLFHSTLSEGGGAVAQLVSPLPTDLKPARLSAATADLLIINAVVPTLFAFAQEQQDAALAERALAWLAQLPPERNRILKAWEGQGVRAVHAAEAQALMQLDAAFGA